MPITQIRYHREEDLEPQREIHRGYFREIIHQYGVDAVYFRKDLNFYESPSGSTVNYAYGEETTATYFLSAGIILYMEMEGDSILMNRFGIETDGDASCYILIEDFTEQFRDSIGTERLYIPDMQISGEIIAGSGVISADIIAPGLTGTVSDTLYFNVDSLSATGDVSAFVDLPFVRTPSVMNPFTKSSPAYVDQATSGTLSGDVFGTLDVSGNGTMSGNLSGSLIYRSTPAEKAGPHWDISPQVGDFFRIQFHDGINNEEYEISRISDKDLVTDGLNPLLDRYIWKMSVTRRDPSYEMVIGDDSEEPWTQDKSEQSDFHEIESDEIFDYDTESVDAVDGTNSDDIYGSYSRNIYGGY
tara:strand:+ start:340 stop:1413 length:1074 start_codon:yes stop_codon:yes gene_type:complete